MTGSGRSETIVEVDVALSGRKKTDRNPVGEGFWLFRGPCQNLRGSHYAAQPGAANVLQITTVDVMPAWSSGTETAGAVWERTQGRGDGQKKPAEAGFRYIMPCDLA
ncbi:hypothetical protein P3T42_003558 [Paraburkholderia sp. GAS38]